MSTSADFRLATPINAAVAASAGRMTLQAAAALASTIPLILQALGQAVVAIENWMEAVDHRHASQIKVHQLHIRPEFIHHLEAALQDQGYRLATAQPTQWQDAEGRIHLIHQVWMGDAGQVGLALLDDGRTLAYVRSLEMESLLRGPILTHYATRVMQAHFAPSSTQTQRFEVPTDDGDTLPTELMVDTRKGVASVEILNPNADERCLGSMARVRQVLGEPVEEFPRVRSSNQPRPVQVEEAIQHRPIEALEKLKVRR